MHTRTLFVVGASHRTASVEFRERVALGQEAEAGFWQDLKDLPGLAEVVVLRTCNRTEIYGVAERSDVARAVCSRLCARQSVTIDAFNLNGYVFEDAEAVQHVLKVSSGLDSQLLGETEIFGQMKRAYAVGQERASVGPILNRLFQKTFQIAKAARTQTAIGSGQVSIANVAVDLARSVFGELNQAQLLLIGTGEIGTKSAKAFRSRGAGAITIASRRLEHAKAAAEELGASAIALEDRFAELERADIVVCAASAPNRLISREDVVSAMALRPSRPMILIDLGMPRNVDRAAAELGSVYLFNLDDLARIAEENRAARQAEASRCRAYLAERSAGLWGQVRLGLASGPHSETPVCQGGTGALQWA